MDSKLSGAAAPPPPPPPSGDRRRHRARRLLVGFLVVANLVVFGALGVVWLAARQVAGSVSTIRAETLDLTREPPLSESRTFLLIGSDSREDIGDLADHFGDVGGERADVVILAQIHPGERRLQLLSLPRDLKIDWEGEARKLNSAFMLSGAAGIIAAVQSHTGLPVHHYVQVDFSGFAGIVDAVGGIQMTFPFPARDLKSGFEVAAGTRVLDGEAALALARSRSYQELRDGTWVPVDANDIGRTRRQQDLLMAMITQIDRPSTIAGYGEMIDALRDFVIMDNSLDADDIIQLAWEMRSVDAEDLDSVTLPVEVANAGGVSYVVERPQAEAAIEAFRRGDPLVSVDGARRIEVQNGNGRAGAAAAIVDDLTAAGYEVVSTVNSARSDYQLTLVATRPSLLETARQVVGVLGFGRATTGRTPAGVDLVVIVGSDAPLP